jgi:hypothetical protein
VKSLAWDRSAVIADVRDRIWSYVTLSAEYAPEGLLVASALLNWPETDALRLGELQFLLSDEVGEFLDAMPRLVRHLSTSSAREEQWTNERLHGPVQWNRTLSLRAATGSPSVYVTAPAERVYQTAENELLVHVLDAIGRPAQSGGWDRDTRSTRNWPTRELRRRLSEAVRWQQSRMLLGVTRVLPTPRSVARVRSSRSLLRYAPVLAAYSKLHSLIEQIDRQAIREAVEHAGLVTADEATLFELFTTFRLLDALDAHSWSLQPFRRFSGHVTTYGNHHDGCGIRLWYQHTPSGLGKGSRYVQVQAAHNFMYLHDLRPDIVLKWTDKAGNEQWLVIECKLSDRSVRHAARWALADLLAYKRSFDLALTGVHPPYGLGVAWGAGLHPASSSEIALCTPDTLAEAISLIVI